MTVQSVTTITLYGGTRTRDLCRDCSATIEQMIADQAASNHFAYLYDGRGDWREGECAEHAMIAGLTRNMARNTGAR